MGEEGQIFKREYSKKSFFLKILLSMIYQTRCKTTLVMYFDRYWCKFLFPSDQGNKTPEIGNHGVSYCPSDCGRVHQQFSNLS